MGRTILCQIKRADNPYYINDVDINIWSLEELCYFIDYNLPLIDEGFFTDALIEWINTELGLHRPAREILRLRQEKNDETEQLVYLINAETGWIYAEDRALFSNEVQDIQRLPVSFRLRKKADCLVSYRKYTRAINIYRAILQKEEKDNAGSQFFGTVYHNMGVAYARLFQFDEACECMKEAWELLHSSGTLRSYLYCVRMNKGEDEFLRLASELRVDESTLADMEEEIARFRMKSEPENIDEALGNWVRQYHRETGL